MKNKTNPLENKKPIRIIYLILVVVLLSATLFFGRNSFLKVILNKREVASLEQKVNILKAENEKLRKENHELKTNPEVIEKIAREQLGYQKSNEKVYRFIPPPPEEKNTKRKE
jgi:cell division protein FtsL